MRNRFTINESERERILKLHEDEKPGLINRIKGAVQGFKNPTVATPTVSAATPTVSAATPTVSAATPTVSAATPTTSAATSAATTSWATSADNSTVCQTKPSKTMSPQVKQIQGVLNKVLGAKPESKTIKGCSGNTLFPLKEDGYYGANTAKAILIAINYKKLSGQGQPPVQQGQPQTGQPQTGQPQQGQPQQGQPQQGQPQQGQPQQGQPQAGATDLTSSPEQAGSTVVNEF